MLVLNSEDQKFLRVADFYNDKSLFITGASGYIGGVLLETLFRCSPGIKNIYILLRSKKNVQPEARKEQIFNKKIFERLKEETPHFMQKVHVISGEASLPNLGMSEEDTQLLIDEVSVVFHCAAVINFMKPLKSILQENVLSLNTVIGLCRKIRKFEALVYTSTAYSNSNHRNVTLREHVYRLPFRVEKFFEALKNDNDKKLQELYAQCKPDWPNTYAFSKSLAENLIMDTASDLPIAIVRPSVVFSSWKHPIPGYWEEASGLAALTIGLGKGFLKVVYANPSVTLNLVPVDVVANAHVLAAMHVGTTRSVSPMVVNCTTSENLHIRIDKYCETMSQIMTQYPLPQSFIAHPHFTIVSNRFLYYLIAAFCHYLPAIVFDGWILLSGKKPRIYFLYRFLDAVNDSLSFFGFNQLHFERNNMEYLNELVHPEERKDLSLDFKECTFVEEALKIKEVAPFYDWKRDKKSPSERNKIKNRRYIVIKFIQGMFIVLSCLFIFWIFSLIF